MISEVEIAWLAGLLEGEGNFGFNWNATHTGKSPRVRVGMTDEDIINRISDLYFRITNKQCRVRITHYQKKQTVYEVCIYGEHANTIMRLIVGYMGNRRRQKIWQTLNGYEPPKAVPILTLLDKVTA